jgi:hypothetical protein
MALLDLLEGKKIITMMGMAKNTGKTVALNKIINGLFLTGKNFAVTSIGFDGEDNDSINYLIEKPKIFIPEGNFIASTDTLLKQDIKKIKIIAETDFSTPLGNVQVAKVMENGEFKIAGPSTVNGMLKLIDSFKKLKVDKILIDGAINRRAMSSPLLCDGFILSTGAVLNYQIDEVVKETKNMVKLISIPVSDNKRIKEISEENDSDIIIGNENNFIAYDDISALNNEKLILEKITDEMNFMILRTSLNDNLIKGIISNRKGKYFQIIISDSMKLFTLPANINKYEKKGLFIRVLFPSKLIAITINPVAPLSHLFDSNEFLSKLKDSIPSIPVIDALSGDNI